MRRALLGWLGVCVAAGAIVAALAGAGTGLASSPDDPVYKPGTAPMRQSEESEQRLLELDKYYVGRLVAGSNPLTLEQANELHGTAVEVNQKLRATAPKTKTFGGGWTSIGPDPMVEVTRSSFSLSAFQGRVGALAIQPGTGQIILGGAQGGIWLFDANAGEWVPKTDFLQSIAIGALAIAPSNPDVIYAGTGEGALSGDSYIGFGVVKSTDGGNTWTKVSGNTFRAVAMSRIVVNPTNPNDLYAAVLRGRGGARRVTPPNHTKLGIWRSIDGGVHWKLLRGVASDSNGATDLEMDPQNPSILYASFWSDAIYKSTDGGKSWSKIMNFGFTSPDFASTQTRFSISLSHPSPGGSGVLYAGFDWADSGGYHPARVFKSTDGGSSWTMLPAGDSGPQGIDDSVEDYCGTQCFYDNVVEADPNNPDVVFVGGSYGYGLSPQSGGIYRSDDGGNTWLNIGWDLHPDFHALAFDPTAPGGVIVGNDGGVWYSTDLGGRTSTSDPLSNADWIDLNCCGLNTGQFTSIATNPNLTPRFWGGTQDNGTQRKSASTTTWFDMASGDGGQVLVDPTDFHYVYGTYYGVSPYRITDGGAAFFTNQAITRGINLGDRSEFYIPWVMNPNDPEQLFLGTYRLYRTDNAKAASAGDVQWKAISPDLTSGCTGTAPNGARTCAISAIGVGGGTRVYSGSLDGLVYVSPDATVNPTPTWTRVGKNLPQRPATQFAVDRSNDRIAYLSYAGYNQATPGRAGHVFKTTDGGMHWQNISTNLPDVPVNSIVLDPSFPNTLYAGTDVGPYVTEDGGVHWVPLGSGFPTVNVWQLDLDPFHRTLAAGTHGRGAWKLTDSNTVPALVVSKVDAGVPVGPGSDLDYTITLRNIGNADATGVTITDPVPAGTTFESADGGGSLVNGKVTWTGKTVPSVPDGTGGSIELHFTVKINNPLGSRTQIVDDGLTATSSEGPSTTGSAVVTPIAPAYGVKITPATQTDGAHVGDSVDYTVHVRNEGFNTDSFTMSYTGGYAASFFQADCTTPLTTTPSLSPGDSTDVCVEVDVPGGAANGTTNVTTVKATSVGNPAASGTAQLTTIAVAVDTLLVDGDGNIPDVQSYYTTALNTDGIQYSVWDLGTDSNIPENYMKAFKNIVWFTGNTYPGPITSYEARLQAFLDNGGRLFMSGQDILDQTAGTTDFVHDYLHITWDGTETQNDKATADVTSTGGASSLTDGIGTVPIDHSVLGAAFEDEITPNGTALGIFEDDNSQTDALQFSDGYKVVFLAFPLEAYGSAAQKADLVSRVFDFFGP